MSQEDDRYDIMTLNKRRGRKRKDEIQMRVIDENEKRMLSDRANLAALELAKKNNKRPRFD
jgi:hypothetical protein